MSEGNYSGQKACSSPSLDISRFNLPPLRPCTVVAFQFFSPSNKINPLRAIDQVNFRAWQPLRRAPIFHREKKIRPRAPSSHEISCRPISRANHSTYLLSDDCHRANSPVNSSPSRNYGLFNRGFSPGACTISTIVSRTSKQFIELSKDRKGFEAKSAKFDFTKSVNSCRYSSRSMFLYIQYLSKLLRTS